MVRSKRNKGSSSNRYTQPIQMQKTSSNEFNNRWGPLRHDVVRDRCRTTPPTDRCKQWWQADAERWLDHQDWKWEVGEVVESRQNRQWSWTPRMKMTRSLMISNSKKTLDLVWLLYWDYQNSGRWGAQALDPTNSDTMIEWSKRRQKR